MLNIMYIYCILNISASPLYISIWHTSRTKRVKYPNSSLFDESMLEFLIYLTTA